MHTDVHTAHGVIELTWQEEKLTSIDLPNSMTPTRVDMPKEDCSPQEAWFHAYFGERQQEYTPEWEEIKQWISTSEWSDTAERVYHAMYDIPYGKTMTYQQLAEIAQTGPRAVGMYCRINKYPLLIPCHRVVPSDGTLGNYSAGGGPAYKAKLLAWESGATG